MSTINFVSHETKFVLPQKTKYRLWVKEVIKSEKKILHNIDYIFCTDNYLLQLNNGYLQHDYFTDIITFDYSKPKEICGELFISIERVKDNAKTFKTTQELEIQRVMIHGVLHLCGYKDKTKQETAKMRAAELKYMALFSKC
jgi:probable rRNA maturation factor